MKSKAGQWVRVENYIGQFVEQFNKYFVLENPNWFSKMASKGKEHISLFKNKYLTEQKSTPQELVRSGDLVKVSNVMVEVWVYGEEIYMENDEDVFISKEIITEIWTKASEDTYKCQWRKENE